MALIDKTRVLTPEQQQAAQLKKEKRAAQARINGKLSLGPVTPEGKKKSSRNAIRHGLTANEHTLLALESPEEYQEVLQSFIADLRPATKAELRLVEKIANLDWRLERFVMMETAVLNLETGLNVHQIADRFERIDAIGFLVEAWKISCSTSQCLDLLRRYMGTLQHQFNTTLTNFRNFEKARLARTRGGLNLDEEFGPPYQSPKFENIRPPEEDAPPSPDGPRRANDEIRPGLQPNEPIRPSKSSNLQPITKRPAA